MTTVVFDIGGTDYGDCVQQADIWQESLNGVGRWEVITDPAGPCAWPAVNTITADSSVHLQINAATMMRGYIDDVLPFLDRKGYYTRLYKITGRNRGMDLAQHFVSAQYQNTAADAIIGNAAGSLLAITPSELTRVTVGAAPGNIDYEADRTYLSDAVREVLDLVNYDYYVDNTALPANANLNLFAIGTSASGVTLIDFPGSATNNILHINPCGEEVGFNIKNYIEGTAGSLQDHYTDLNGVADWVGTNAAVTDDVVVFLNGKGAIRATNNTGVANLIAITLSFPLYSHAVLDLSEPCIGSYNYLVHDTANAIKRVRLQLTDLAGRTIEFYRSAFGGFAKCRNCTDQLINDEWRKVDFPLGDESGIEPALLLSTQGIWYDFNAPPPVFNWSQVTDIEFATTAVAVNALDYFIVDGLTFPNSEVISIQTNGASIGLYGQRMKDFYRPDIKNQYELDAFVTQKLDRLKDPKETIRVVTTGQTGTPYAGQTVEVVAPTFGIGGPAIGTTVTYRILRLHHKVVKNSDESDELGYTFTTEYDLVRQQYYGTATTQLNEYEKIINTTNPVQAFERQTRILEQYRRRGGKGVRLSP